MAKMTVLPRAARRASSPEVAPRFDVERRRRLVEQQQVRVGDERNREPHALGLAPGQLRGPAAGEASSPVERERVVDLERARVQRRDHRHEFADAQVVDQRPRLEHPADDAGGDRLGRRHPEQRHASRSRGGSARASCRSSSSCRRRSGRAARPSRPARSRGRSTLRRVPRRRTWRGRRGQLHREKCHVLSCRHSDTSRIGPVEPKLTSSM